MIKYISIFWMVLRCLLVARKENSTGFSTGLTGRLKNLYPTENPTGAGRPDRFPSLVLIQAIKTLLQKVRETRYTYVTLNFISISNTFDSPLPIGRQSNHIWLFNNSAQVDFKIN